jgi:hypothetical protein
VRAAHDLVGDQDEDGDGEQRRAEGHEQEDPVAEPVADTSAATQLLRDRDSAHPR